MVEADVRRAPAPAGRRFPKLKLKVRRAVLVVHVVSAGAWIGIDVVIGVLVVTAMATASPSTESLAYRALELFAIWPLLAAGLTCLASGIVLGLGTQYGLVKLWWVAVKLVLNLVLLAAVLFALRPAVSEAARYGAALAAGRTTDAGVGQLLFPPVVSAVALVFATVLSIYKPWGRIRKRRDAGATG